MIEVRRTAEFDRWLDRLRDEQAVVRIQIRIDRIEDGNYGDHKRFQGLLELRLKYGPGYRIYAVERGNVVVILLVGGDKSSQKRDIERALALAKTV